MNIKRLVLLFFLTVGCANSVFCADIRVYIKNNAVGTQIFDVIILGRTEKGSGKWTTVWGGQKSSRVKKDENFGFGELRKFVFKDESMAEYQIRFTAKLGELNLVEEYFQGPLVDGSLLLMDCTNGICSLAPAQKLIPQSELVPNL